MSNTAANGADQSATQPQFGVQRVYLKDASFEAPRSPEIFQQEWHPEVGLELHTQTKQLQEGLHEVTLSVTVTVKSGESVAFLIELKQAGVFVIKNFPADQLHVVLGSVCPGVLFPYVRERVSSFAAMGGFPQLLLAPVDFQQLYLQHLQQQQAKQQQVSETDTVN